MAVQQLIPSFNSGELSPYLDARSDLDKYASGCRFLENFIVLPYGGIYRRPGTEYLGAAKYSNKLCRLLGFNFSTTTRFILEVGELYIRFWSNGVQVQSVGVPLEVTTPYYETELRDLQFVQINDVMYFVHPLHAPRKLTRVADDNWTFADVVWDWPALLDENIEATTITPSAATGTGITLTASAALFDVGHVGSYWQIGHARTSAYVERSLGAAGTSSNIKVLGDWGINSYGSWTGEYSIQRSYDNGTTWETIRSYKSAADYNTNATGREETEALLRINMTSYSSGSGRALITVQEARVYGVVKITGFTSNTVVTADVLNDMATNTATKFWSEGAWSQKRGFPRAVTLHEQRIFYAGTSARPQSIWGSVINDFETFRLYSNDDAGLFFTLSSQQANAIQWLVSQSKLLIGTAGEEWTLASSDTNSTITPTSVLATRQSSYGSKYLRAMVVNDVILFVQRQGRKVRELVYSFEQDGYKAPDLTMLSEHVTKGEILECAFAQQPDAIYWTITGEGQLVGMTYERDQNVVGWHRHTTQGAFESVATIYGASGADEVWVSVKRTINGQDVRYIERFRTDFRDTFESEDKPNWWYLDCAKRVTMTPESATVTGFEHLNGKMVDILADGAVSPSRTVAGGQITLQAPAGKVLVGLQFVSQFKPMKLEIQLPTGTSRGKFKRLAKAVVGFLKSLGGQYSSDGTEWFDIYSRTTNDAMDSSPPTFSGDKELIVAGDSSRSADLSIRQAQPLPLTILVLVPNYEVQG